MANPGPHTGYPHAMRLVILSVVSLFSAPCVVRAPAQAMDPSAVQVSAADPVLEQRTAYNDCCFLCEEQTLEALTPQRVAVCGRATRYVVNDELGDPRDITINIIPDPGFESLLVGAKTECTAPCSNCVNGRCATYPPGACIHVEVTPDNHFYGQDDRFLPIDSSGPCADGDEGCRSVLEAGSGTNICVYGVHAFDHGVHRVEHDYCRFGTVPSTGQLDPSHDTPEIHPFDAIWWPIDGGWAFAVFQDDSNRYSFSHCGDDNNGNEWSRPPRDVTFRFPFSYSAGEYPVCARLRRFRTVKDGLAHSVFPHNVTTADQPALFAENKLLRGGRGGATALEVEEEFDAETLVTIEGSAGIRSALGSVVVRVAVGCNPRRTTCTDVDGPEEDGFYFGQLTFETGTSCQFGPLTATPTPGLSLTLILPSRPPRPTLTPTPPTAPACGGDCDRSGAVTVNELVTMVNVALERAQVSACPAGDRNRNGGVTVDEILAAVGSLLNGCP